MMPQTRHAVLGLAALFVLVLTFVTFQATTTPLDLGGAEREAAQQSCQLSVRARLPDARFPNDASVETRAASRLYLSGSVDAGAPGQTVRRNYECLLRREAEGPFVAESVRVWQSH